MKNKKTTIYSKTSNLISNSFNPHALSTLYRRSPNNNGNYYWPNFFPKLTKCSVQSCSDYVRNKLTVRWPVNTKKQWPSS